MLGIIEAYPVIAIVVFVITGAIESFSRAAQYLKAVIIRNGAFVITSAFSIPSEPQGTGKAGASPGEQLAPIQVELVIGAPVIEPLTTTVAILLSSIVRWSKAFACNCSAVSEPVQDTPQTCRTTDGFKAKVVNEAEADLDCAKVEFVRYPMVTNGANAV
ncbi:unannotated protein [freshwater metagenome]|uniref:Unannotated protein n=1 Tax=freshwater metagenome TaxID=449393 RepID=A0A6J7UD97_9ZZZZ